MIDQFVTGASGFIGQRLWKQLYGRGKSISIEHNDIADELFWMMPFRRFFFLSAYGNLATQTNQRKMLESNIAHLGRILARICDDSMNPESFIFVSTSSVNLPVQTAYSRTKRAGEEMVLAMPIPGCVVRPYSVTGVGEQPEHLIPTLIRSCLDNEPMYFVPHAAHDFVDVSDIASGLITLADAKATGVFELGTGTPTTNEDVKFLVENITGKKANIQVVGQLRGYDSMEWYCRDFRVQDYGWKARKPLDRSIVEMVEAYGK